MRVVINGLICESVTGRMYILCTVYAVQSTRLTGTYRERMYSTGQHGSGLSTGRCPITGPAT